MKNKCGCCKLSALSLGVAAAAVSALGIATLGLLNMHLGLGAKWIELISTVYQGYAANWHGIGIGASYAAVEGFSGGLVFGWVYNICISCVRKCCASCQSTCKKNNTDKTDKSEA